jgi:SAM-dependent methyltransferase
MPSIYEIAASSQAFKTPSYLPVYEKLFEPVRDRPLSILELGVFGGGSLRAWEEYFPNAVIAGVDLDPPNVQFNGRVRMYKGDQADIGLLSKIAAEVAPEGFDVIIDDCAHIGAVAKASFWYLFENHLKPGGLYSIEDWGTGYWPTWPDGRRFMAEPDSQIRLPSHDAGMVGFVKQLVDEVAAADIKDAYNSPPPRQSRFSEVSFHLGLCIVRKSP